MDFGLNIGEGAALGILRNMPEAKGGWPSERTEYVGRIEQCQCHTFVHSRRGRQRIRHSLRAAHHYSGRGLRPTQAVQLTVAELECMLQRVLQEQRRRSLAIQRINLTFATALLRLAVLFVLPTYRKLI